MRTMLKVSLEVEAGNEAIQSGRLGEIIGMVSERIKPEASYFFTEQGQRTALFVFDMKDQSQIPPIAEIFFTELKAEVQFTPVMNKEDLQSGLQASAHLHHATV